MKKITLKNGLTVILCQQNNMKTTVVDVLAHGGTRYETTQTNGISHFIEHVIFQESENPELEFGLNASTHVEFVSIFSHHPTSMSEIYLKKIADMMFTFNKNDQEIELERNIIIEEIQESECGDSTLYQDLYKDCFLGLSTWGGKKNIKKLSKYDLEDAQKRIFSPKNVVVVILADFKNMKNIDIEKKIQNIFDRPKKSYPLKKQLYEKAPLIRFKGAHHEHIQNCIINVATFCQKNEEFLLPLLTKVVDYFLYEKLRNQDQIAYDTHFDIQEYSDMQIWSWDFSGNFRKNAKVMKVILEIFKELISKEMDPMVFQRIKEITQFNLERIRQVPEHHVSFISEKALFKKEMDIQKIMKQLRDITPKNTREFIGKILSKAEFSCMYYGMPHVKQKKNLTKLMEEIQSLNRMPFLLVD